jgi:catechol 2,3-dioxygenase-like lactoylglutathione lyase family enzyme
VKAVAGLAEIVLWTHDMDRSLAFYRDLFGLEVISPPDFPKLFLSAGTGPAGIPEMIVLMPHPDPGGSFPSPKPERVLHHMAFAVESGAYDDLETRCRAAGLEVRQGIHPVLKSVRTFYVDDPEGNEVEIIAREP